jgi:hypothetical protein
VTDLETIVRDELDLLVPDPRRSPAWADVLRRVRTRRRRVLTAVLAAALVVVGSGAAVAAALGGFDAWLSGDPGAPASAEEQARFDEANSRSWVAFPKGTRLRELIRTEVDGKRYVLLGFRSGDALCLRLEALSFGAHTEDCAPVSALARLSDPLLVIEADHAFGMRDTGPREPGEFAPVAAFVTFGIAADGVRAVELEADDGVHEALVGGNAFLLVEPNPPVGNLVRHVVAVDQQGQRRPVQFAQAAFGMFPGGPPSAGPPAGPIRAEATIEHPTVGWFDRREPRGEPLDFRTAGPLQATYARVVQPDGLSNIRVGLASVKGRLGGRGPEAEVCRVVVQTSSQGAGCGSELFQGRPVAFSESITNGGNQFAVIDGVAADGVARIEIFLAGGQSEDVPLRDNLFVALVPRARFPVRVVGYDPAGRVVSTELAEGERPAAPQEAVRSVRPVLRLTGPNGTLAILRVGDPAGGVRCWSLDFAGGGSGGGCTPWPYEGPPPLALGVQPAGRDVFVTGQVPAAVATVELRLPGGEVEQVRPIAGHVVFPLPLRYLDGERHVVVATGLDPAGKVVARQGIAFKS